MLNIQKGDCISIVGAGGKTTLMFRMAKLLSDKKVCVTTTTKILKPEPDTYDQLYYGDLNNEVFDSIHNGLTVMGGGLNEHNKLTSLSFDNLDKCCEHFDYVLIEADGSKERPLKGWNEFEPVIVSNTTKTICVLDISVITKVVDENTVFRIPEFEKITSAADHDTILTKHLAELATHPKGLLKNNHGEVILYINKVESNQDEQHVLDLLHQLDMSCYDRIIIGSLKLDDYHLIYGGNHITNIVMASGYSKRMGDNKLLMTLKDKKIIEHVFSKMITHEKQPTLVVTKDDALDALLSKYAFDKIINHHADKGQSESIVLGVESVGDSDGFMLFVADQPFMKIKSLFKIISRFNLTDKIVMCKCDNHYGNPVIFPKRYYQHLVSLNGDIGARSIIQKHIDDVEYVLVNDLELTDIDTLETYEFYKNS